MGIYEELEWRGLIKDVSSPELKEKLNKGGMTFYIGTDPTADSLHVGHLSSFLISKRLKDAGHNPILLVGGAILLLVSSFMINIAHARNKSIVVPIWTLLSLTFLKLQGVIFQKKALQKLQIQSKSRLSLP